MKLNLLKFFGLLALTTAPAAKATDPKDLLPVEKDGYVYIAQDGLNPVWKTNVDNKEVRTKFHDTDERRAIIHMAQLTLHGYDNVLAHWEHRDQHYSINGVEGVVEQNRPLGLNPNYKIRVAAGLWGSIKLESTLYYSRTLGDKSTTYTIFGHSDKLTPKDYKIQIYVDKDKDGFFFRSMKVTNSWGKVVSYFNPKDAPLDTLIHMEGGIPQFRRPSLKDSLRNEELEKREPIEGFFAEKNYLPKTPTVEDKNYHLNLDPELIKEGAVAGGEALLWKVSNRIPKMNTGKLRTMRRFGKLFVVVEEGGHLLNAYEVVTEGGKPKYITVGPDLLVQLKSVSSKVYDALPDAKTTGALVDQSEMKKSLERETFPHAKKEEVPAAHSPNEEDAQTAKKRREEALKKLKGE